MEKSDQMKKAIQDVIQNMMDMVIERALVTDPFDENKHRSTKPLYSALVPDEIFKSSHFERKFTARFGDAWEKLAIVAINNNNGIGKQNHRIDGFIRDGQIHRINEVIDYLEHKKEGQKKIKPNWTRDINFIKEGKGDLVPVSVICDVYGENNTNKNRFAFELKGPLPDSDQTKASLQKILKLHCMEPRQIEDAYFALPYNPFGRKENYNWSYSERWFNMKEDPVVLIGNEFWDKIGGVGTYEVLIEAVNEIATQYKDRIYHDYLKIEPPIDYNSKIL